MMTMLNEMPDFNFGKLTDHHFNKFFEMGTKVFDDFLGNCFFQNQLMDGINKVEWNRRDDYFLMAYHTSFLDQDFINMLGKNEEETIVGNEDNDSDGEMVDGGD